ncbi:MAG: hypothetical protein II140_02945 [Paludibacteraceae bacterium]|nr:hypothetical protein [Paludibacteraceae bacterium]
MVLCNNAELANPCKAGRSQGVIALLGGSRFSRSAGRTLRGVDVSRYSKGL